MHRSMPPLTALRAFEAAARHLSLTKAATELHVTAGALSHQIRGLEDLLGLKLFERRVRSIALTPAGKLLYPGLQTGFARIQEAAAGLHRQMAGAAALPFRERASRHRRAGIVVLRLRQFHDRRDRRRATQPPARCSTRSGAGHREAGRDFPGAGLQPAAERRPWAVRRPRGARARAADP